MKKVIIAALVLAPGLVFAQALTGIDTLVRSIGRIVGLALPIVVGIALLAFFWGLVKYIFAQGNEESKADGKKIMLWGLIALFVMIAVWGLVQFGMTALNINPLQSPPVVPTVPNI